MDKFHAYLVAYRGNKSPEVADYFCFQTGISVFNDNGKHVQRLSKFSSGRTENILLYKRNHYWVWKAVFRFKRMQRKARRLNKTIEKAEKARL